MSDNEYNVMDDDGLARLAETNPAAARKIGAQWAREAREIEERPEKDRQYRANLARQAHEADELFKHRLILVVIVIIIFVILASSGSLNSWLNAAPDCYDRSCFGGGA